MGSMARRTVHLPDDLDKRVRESGTIDDSFSAVVQEALRQHLDRTGDGQERELEV